MIRITLPPLNEQVVKLVERAGIARQVLIDTFKGREKPSVDEGCYKAFKSYLLESSHHKCAYCETVISAAQPVEVEHYRPKNRVTDESNKPIEVTYPTWGKMAHLGYFWLAYELQNLLPSCIDCNRSRYHGDARFGKGDRFPVDGFRAYLPGDEVKEKPLLLNPAREDFDPNTHFEFFRNGQIRGLTPEGHETISLLGLNTREYLVRERARAYRGAELALAEFLAEVRREDSTTIDQWRDDVNKIWAGLDGYSAFGRLALRTVQARYATSGLEIKLPLPDAKSGGP